MHPEVESILDGFFGKMSIMSVGKKAMASGQLGAALAGVGSSILFFC